MAIGDLQYKHGFNQVTLIGENRIGSEKFEQRYAGGSECYGQIPAQLGINTHFGCIIDGIIDTDILQYFYGDQVAGLGQGPAKRGGAIKSFFEIFRLPGKVTFFVFKYDGGVNDYGCRGVNFFGIIKLLVQGGRIDNRFERALRNRVGPKKVFL